MPPIRRRPATPSSQRLLRGFRVGHRVELLTDGHASWLALSRSIERASVSIDIQLYILEPDDVSGAFVAALCRAQARGVRVRLMLDGLGCAHTDPAHMALLVEAGVLVRVFGPLRLSVPWRSWLRRNHRKIFIFDRRNAIVAGFNVGQRYLGVTPHQPVWLDIGALLAGPTVSSLNSVLDKDWHRWRRRLTGPSVWRFLDALGPNAHLLEAERATQRRGRTRLVAPPVSGRAEGPVRLSAAVSSGHLLKNPIRNRYLDAIDGARRSIWLAHAYFLPDRRLDAALIRAARRGVVVKILLPNLRVSDVKAVALASLHGLNKLLRAGIEVRFADGPMLHAKLGIVDGVWWTLGSANLDTLSRTRNLEANVVGYGRTQAGELERLVAMWYTPALPWRLADDLARPWWMRWLGRLAWAFRGLL